jgi:retron-type reverse transcriptase
VNWIADLDVASFFDRVSHVWLIRFVEHRIGDRRVLRLIEQWLKAGAIVRRGVSPGGRRLWQPRKRMGVLVGVLSRPWIAKR